VTDLERSTPMRNQVQLIAYADRLGGTFAGLTELVRGPLAGLFGGIHVLPFFDPIDGADAGFDPNDHREVDPRLGTWEDVGRLGETLPIMADLIVNHVATGSPQFQDFLTHGDASEHAGLFLTFDRVFPDGAREADLLALYRPRPGLPLTLVTLGDRSRRIMWTTFTANQLDIDVGSPQGRDYLERILDNFAANGIRMVRLDAVGYAVKTAGSSSFMTPETFAFIDELTASAHRRDIEVLVEVHSYWRKQLEIAQRVDWVYDFALPPLVLHALYSGNAERLRHWFEVRPRNAVTVLDTHDGIGVVDVGPSASNAEHLGLLAAAEIDELVEGIHEHSHGASRLATGAAASNVDLYQVNCTYFDALGADPTAYLIARLLQVWVPGVPQIYYVGLLAGHNDVELLHRTGVGRDINRHHYRRDEIDQALTRPVVQRLAALLELRNTHPAFDGDWQLLDAGHEEGRLAMRWTAGEALAELTVDLRTRTYAIRITEAGRVRTVTDLAELIEQPS
jgi:sucrose phosphorylase